MPVSPETHARTVLAAHEHRRQIAPLTGWDPDLDLAAAYRVADAVRALREARGERPVGRKIGFTNTRMWAEHGVRAPIWSHVYDTTVREAADLPGPLPLAALVEPRIEPEIVFGLARPPEPGLDPAGLAACLAWVAPGFEMVQSLFPGWRFAAPDTVAAFGLHGTLVLGERVPVRAGEGAAWAARLADFTVTLARDGITADRGVARNVMGGGPLAALGHLVDVLANDPVSPPLAAGEIVSTGTLTRALPAAPGETWAVHLAGLPLRDLTLRLA